MSKVSTEIGKALKALQDGARRVDSEANDGDKPVKIKAYWVGHIIRVDLAGMQK